MQLDKIAYQLVKVTLVAAVTFIVSCSQDQEREIGTQFTKGKALGVAYEVRMVYTDSLKIKAILTAAVHEDYTNLSLPYSVFPQGVKVTFVDDLKRENIITADRGIMYQNTNIIDLQGNVVLKASDGGILTTTQLYWDAEYDWIFTEKAFNFVNDSYDVNATRLDTNKEFTKFQTGKLTGTVAVEDQNTQ